MSLEAEGRSIEGPWVGAQGWGDGNLWELLDPGTGEEAGGAEREGLVAGWCAGGEAAGFWERLEGKRDGRSQVEQHNPEPPGHPAWPCSPQISTSACSCPSPAPTNATTSRVASAACAHRARLSSATARLAPHWSVVDQT